MPFANRFLFYKTNTFSVCVPALADMNGNNVIKFRVSLYVSFLAGFLQHLTRTEHNKTRAGLIL